MAPCVIFEDEHLLVANKPAGWNTHAPGPLAGEGLYDWLRHREPRWTDLALLHRLDKETSGIILFGKTPLANRSLTEQFTAHRVHKKYVLLTDRTPPARAFTVKTALVSLGEKYGSRPGGQMAETQFATATDARSAIRDSRFRLLAASPLTGRTHQIRVHASESGFPILGDTLYGGTPAARVFLHAAEISFNHPATGRPVSFSIPANFETDLDRRDALPLIQPAAGPGTRLALRSAIIEPDATNAWRMIHGASDGWPGWFVDKLGDYLLSQSDQPLNARQAEQLFRLAAAGSSRGAYHKILSRQVGRTAAAEISPHLVLGEPAPGRFEILENGLRYEMSFNEGYSVGLFPDQRDNRRRLLTGHIAAGFAWPASGSEVLNCFAYTCGFSVCAAQAGARTTSLDLSRKYLDWGRRNFARNGLDPAAHDFIFGDTFDWLRRLARKGRRFDAVVLDPPTFSQSKEHGTFRAEKDFGKLVAAALPVLKPGGVLFASTNAADWPPEAFLAAVATAIGTATRRVRQRHYAPQPPDFPISRAEPAYLKTVWLRVE